MNKVESFWYYKAALIFGGCVLMALPAMAAPPVTVPDLRSQQIGNAVAAAAAGYVAGDEVNADAAATQANQSQPGTGEWFLEAATRNMDAAVLLSTRRAGNPVRKAAEKALNYLSQAEKKFQAEKNDRGQAIAAAQAGVVSELFFSDYAGALDCYQRALQLNPKSSSAQRQVDRLTRIVASLPKR